MPLYTPATITVGGYLPSDAGYIGWSGDPGTDVQAGTIIATAGTLNLVRIKIPAGGSTVTNIVLHLTVGGTSLTAGQCFAALYTSAGALAGGTNGVTADQSTSWGTGGLKVMPLTAAQSVSGPFVYVGFFANNTAGTNPTLARMVSSSSAIINAGLSAPTFRYATADASLTTAPPTNFGTQTGLGTAWWVGLT